MSVDHITQSKVPKYQCPPDKKSERIYNDDRSGLNLYLTRNGARTWDFQFKDPVTKKTAHIKIGRAEDITLADAKEKVSEHRKVIATGIDPRYHQQEIASGDIVYPEFMTTHYLPHVQSHKRSWTKDKEIFEHKLQHEFKSPLKSISRRQIQEYQTKLLDSGLAPATCNRAIQLVRHSLNLAVDWDMLDKNPAERIKMFREDNEVERYLSDEQLLSLVSVLKSDHNRPVSRIIFMLLSCGTRLSETLHAKWKNIDKGKRTWKIPVADAKSGKSRVVVLSDAAMSVLDECPEDSEWLFPNPKTDKPYTTISRVWYRIRKEAGIDEFRIHDLRHSYASYLAQGGESTITIAESLGHSDYRTSSRYVHLNQDTMRKATNHASDKIMAALDKASGDDPDASPDNNVVSIDADLKKASGEN